LTDTPIKVRFNVTQVTFNLYKNKDGEVSVTTETLTINQRRQLPYIENYLKSKFKDYLAIEIEHYEYKAFTASIPFSLALEYGEERQDEEKEG
jgi:orf3 protein